MTQIRIEIDIRTSELTMLQVVEEVKRMQNENPDRDYYMDGDCYAVVSKPKWRSEA